MARQVGVKAHSSEEPVEPAPEALRECTVCTHDGSRLIVTGWQEFTVDEMVGDITFTCDGKTVGWFNKASVLAITNFKDM